MEQKSKFDKVMGALLKEHPEYKPVVYKAYAYGTAWEAEPDFYSENIQEIHYKLNLNNRIQKYIILN